MWRCNVCVTENDDNETQCIYCGEAVSVAGRPRINRLHGFVGKRFFRVFNAVVFVLIAVCGVFMFIDHKNISDPTHGSTLSAIRTGDKTSEIWTRVSTSIDVKVGAIAGRLANMVLPEKRAVTERFTDGVVAIFTEKLPYYFEVAQERIESVINKRPTGA